MRLKKYLILLLIIINVPLFSRDIDLDRIYINSGSLLYRQITEAKENLYREIFSIKVDTGVIFSSWAGTAKIIYIKEAGQLNVVYEYSRGTGRKREICRFRGNVTAAMLSRSGELLAVKVMGSNPPFRAVNLYIKPETGEIRQQPSSALFKDMTFYPGDDSLVYRERSGIVRYTPFSGNKELILPADRFSDMIENNDLVTAHVSPDRRRVLVLSGQGGAYRGRLITGKSSVNITGIASGTDLYWIDNRRFVFRSGSPGNYSVKIYDTSASREMTLLSGTLNPDITFSPGPDILAFLDNQIITILDITSGNRVNTGLEGEVVYFSSDGARFTSLYLGNLYISSVNMLPRRGMEIRRNAARLHSLYRETLENREVHENYFTPEYLRKKIEIYRKTAAGE